MTLQNAPPTTLAAGHDGFLLPAGNDAFLLPADESFLARTWSPKAQLVADANPQLHPNVVPKGKAALLHLQP